MTNPAKSVYTPYLVRFLPVKETKPTTTHTCSHTNNSHRHADTVEGIVLEYWQGLGTAGRLHFHSSLSCTGEGNGDPLQCSCLENPRDGGAWWAAVLGSPRVGHDWRDLAAAALSIHYYCYSAVVFSMIIIIHREQMLKADWDWILVKLAVSC